MDRPNAQAGAARATAADGDYFRLIFDHAPIGISLNDNVTGEVLAVNQRYAELLGQRVEELIGSGCLDATHPDDVEPNRSLLDRLVAGDLDTFSLTKRYLRPNGSWVWAELTVVVVDRVAGDRRLHLAMAQDITASLVAGREQLIGEHRFQILFGHAPLGIALVDTPKRILLEVNAAFARIVGRTIEETRGLDWADITHPDDLSQNLQDVAHWIESAGKTTPDVLKRYLRPDGSAIWVNITSAHLDTGDSARPLHFCIAEDVTESRRTAELLADSERRYRMLADHAADVVLQARDGNLEWVAPSVYSLLGFQPAEFLSMRTVEFIHPDDWSTVLTNRQKFAVGKVVRGEMRFSHRDGHWIWLGYIARPVFDADGSPEGSVVTTLWSIQAEMEAREALAVAESQHRELEAAMERSARLESLGVLAGGVAHDFNNLLVGILGNTEQALALVPHDSPVRAFLEVVATSAERASDLTRQLLDYAGHRHFDGHQLLDARLAIEATMKLVTPLLPSTAVVGVELPTTLAGLDCDRGQLQQVVMNLVINAADALGGRPGRVDVSASVHHLDRNQIARFSPTEAREPGDYLAISVTDNGIGIDETTLQRVFEPFFTTKVEGRGLGLAAVYGIIRSNDGMIDITSAVGEGTTVRVHLPSVPVDSTRGEPSTTASDADGTTEVDSNTDRSLGAVLLVDDNDDVRDVCEMVLSSAGFTVVACHGGRDAIARFGSGPGAYTVAVLDMSMPEMGGPEVLRELRAIQPALPVVLMSGFSNPELNDALRDLHADGFVQKPFRAAALVAAVRKAAQVGHPLTE